MSFFSANRYLVGGLLLLIAAVGAVTVPAVRERWFRIWRVATQTPAAVGQADLGDAQYCSTCHGIWIQTKMNQKETHKPFMEGRCLSCHTKHDPVTNVTRLTADQSQLCGQCHDITKQMAMSNKHVPFKNAWCQACHDSHGADYQYKLKIDPNQLCLTCHNMNVKYWNKKVQHPPFQQRACLGCHVPHASDNAKNTRLPLPYLCISCHPVIARDMEQAVLHPPFSQAWCTMCHNPHATDFPRMVKAPENSEQPLVDLCLQCHGTAQPRLGEINRHISHPMGKHVKDGHEVVDPTTGAQLACISCHHPHGTPNPRMWRRDKDFLCLGCHRMLTGRFNMPW